MVNEGNIVLKITLLEVMIIQELKAFGDIFSPGAAGEGLARFRRLGELNSLYGLV